MKRTEITVLSDIPLYRGISFFKEYLLAATIFCVAMFSGCAGLNSSNMSQLNPDLEKYGIKVQSIRISAEGYMLDFRYRVINKAKAEELFTEGIKPYVIDQKTNSRLIVPSPPKVGSLSQTSNPPLEGKIYFIIFANPGRIVKSGDKVNVVIGDVTIKDIVVDRLYGSS